MSEKNTKKVPIPNGLCWDDCGGTPKPGSFFLTGHDKRAERYLAAINGKETMAQRLMRYGYEGGNGQLRSDALLSDDTLEECGRNAPNGKPCQVIGSGIGIRRHRADDNQHLG